MRRTSTLLVGLTLTAMLAACGAGGDDDAGGPSVTPTTTDEPSESTEATETATEATADPTTEAGATEAEMVQVPADGPTGVTEFPIPGGTTITDLGAFAGGWQFLVNTDDPAAVLAFYEQTLPELGYTVTPDVTDSSTGLVYDLGFSGDVAGAMIDQSLLGGVQVTIADEPFTE